MDAPRFRTGDAAELEVRLTPEDVVRYAELLGDPNPLHHDAAAAAASRFGGLIASGAHVAGLLLAFCARFTTARGPGVGLEFTVSFRRPARAGSTLTLRWEVVGVEASPRLGGDLVSLAGTVRDEAGASLVAASSRMVTLDER